MKPGKNIWWDLEAFGLKVFFEYLILMKNTFVSFSYMRKNIFSWKKHSFWETGGISTRRIMVTVFKDNVLSVFFQSPCTDIS